LLVDSYSELLLEKKYDQARWKSRIGIVDPNSSIHNYDFVIHPGFNGEWLADLGMPNAWGPKYIPIRASLSRISKHNINDHENRLLRILVIAGGGSESNWLFAEVLKLMEKFPSNARVYFVTANPDPDKLPMNAERLIPGRELDDALGKIDLAISAAGSTSLELIALGIPTGIVCMAENQKTNYEFLVDQGLAIGLGQSLNNGMKRIKGNKILELVTNAESQNRLRQNMKGKIDFEGASRIFDLILGIVK